MLILGIDAGHPSSPGDTRLLADSGITESDYAIGMARYLYAVIKHSYLPLNPILIRQRNDEVLSLRERGIIASDANCNLVLSLHVNANAHEYPSGARTFFWPGNESGKKIAESIARSIPDPLYKTRFATPADKDDYPGVHAVLSVYPMTSILIEFGYSTNPGDMLALLDPSTQLGLLTSMLCGIACAVRIFNGEGLPSFGGYKGNNNV